MGEGHRDVLVNRRDTRHRSHGALAPACHCRPWLRAPRVGNEPSVTTLLKPLVSHPVRGDAAAVSQATS